LTEYIFISHGPIQKFDDDGNVLMVLDCQAIEALWEIAETAEGI